MYSKLALLLLFATILGTALGAYDKSTYAVDVTSSLKKLVGLNCISDVVFDLEDDMADFQFSAQKCGNKTRDAAMMVLDDIEDIALITKKIYEINNRECGNGGYIDEDASRSPPSVCVPNFERQLTKLNTALQGAWDDIATLETTIDACGKMALIKLKVNVENVPQIFKFCKTITDAAN